MSAHPDKEDIVSFFQKHGIKNAQKIEDIVDIEQSGWVWLIDCKAMCRLEEQHIPFDDRKILAGLIDECRENRARQDASTDAVLRERIENLVDINSQRQKNIKNLTQTNTELQESIINMTVANEYLQKTLSENNQNIKNLNEEIQSYKKTNTELQESINNMTAANEYLRKTLSENSKEEMAKKIAAMAKKIAELEAQEKNLRDLEAWHSLSFSSKVKPGLTKEMSQRIRAL